MSKCLFFGCWNRAGHYTFEPGGSSAHFPGEYELAGKLDGGFAPRRARDGTLCWRQQGADQKARMEIDYRSAEYPQGQFLRHKLDKYTLISWWDRNQGDGRGACNSTILLEGDHTSAEMLVALAQHFPHVLENLNRANVALVDVTPVTA